MLCKPQGVDYYEACDSMPPTEGEVLSSDTISTTTNKLKCITAQLQKQMAQPLEGIQITSECSAQPPFTAKDWTDL